MVVSRDHAFDVVATVFVYGNGTPFPYPLFPLFVGILIRDIVSLDEVGPFCSLCPFFFWSIRLLLIHPPPPHILNFWSIFLHRCVAYNSLPFCQDILRPVADLHLRHRQHPLLGISILGRPQSLRRSLLRPFASGRPIGFRIMCFYVCIYVSVHVCMNVCVYLCMKNKLSSSRRIISRAQLRAHFLESTQQKFLVAHQTRSWHKICIHVTFAY